MCGSGLHSAPVQDIRYPQGIALGGDHGVDRMDRRQPYWRKDAAAEYDEAEEQETERFQDAHRSFSDKVERFLLHLVILGLVAVTFVQTLHTNTAARRMLNAVEWLEGIPWQHVTAWTHDRQDAVPVSAAAGPLVITVVSVTRPNVPEARLLVDNKPVGTFRDGAVSAEVRPGQSISIDGTEATGPLTFRVVGPVNLVTPALGASVTTRRTVEPLGVISSSGR